MNPSDQEDAQLQPCAETQAGHPGDPEAFTVSVCICTRNRPRELERALQSVRNSQIAVHQVVVADDSDDVQTRMLLSSSFPEAVYVAGPRLGLGANRNQALRLATGSHVLFLDDDAELGRDFLTIVCKYLQALSVEERRRVVVTGAEINGGRTIIPSEQGLLGFQNRPYKPDQLLQTIVINATLFPRPLFSLVQFDPLLRYGYDEVDVATQAVALGFIIMPCFSAANYHFPSAINRSEYSSFKEASRLYATLKRRRFTQNTPVRAWLGFVLAACHLYLAVVKRRGLLGVREAQRTVAQALAYYANFVQSASQLEHPDRSCACQ